jgi:hypothetical protein
MERTKRLYYAPGLISLIGLFVVLPYFYRQKATVKLGVLPLVVPMDCHRGRESNNYSKCLFENELKSKKLVTITINENKNLNKQKLDIIRHEALRLKYFENTTTVILITLSDSINYGDFVAIVDMCEYDGHRRYASWDNKFVIFGEWPKTEVKQNNTITPLYCGTRPYKKPIRKPGFFEIVMKKIKDNYTTQGLYLCIGFTALLASFFISRKKAKNYLRKSD